MTLLLKKNRAAHGRRLLLTEDLAQPRARVDKEAGIIYGVKLLGKFSRNNHGMRDVDQTEYSDAAMEAARGLYENLAVHYDHSPKSQRGEARSVDSRAGKVFGVRYRPGDGLYGNLRLIKSHPLSARLLEAAADPELSNLYAMSHHADGYTTVRGRTLVVQKIVAPKSVDIVTAGGTVRGLFEGRSARRPASTAKPAKARRSVDTVLVKRLLSESIGIMRGQLRRQAAASAAARRAHVRAAAQRRSRELHIAFFGPSRDEVNSFVRSIR